MPKDWSEQHVIGASSRISSLSPPMLMSMLDSMPAALDNSSPALAVASPEVLVAMALRLLKA